MVVPQSSGFSDTGAVFTMQDNGRDHKSEWLEGARFLPRNNLFLPFRHHFVMVKWGSWQGTKKWRQGAWTARRAVLQQAWGGARAHREGLHRWAVAENAWQSFPVDSLSAGLMERKHTARPGHVGQRLSSYTYCTKVSALLFTPQFNFLFWAKK